MSGISKGIFASRALFFIFFEGSFLNDLDGRGGCESCCFLLPDFVSFCDELNSHFVAIIYMSFRKKKKSGCPLEKLSL